MDCGAAEDEEDEDDSCEDELLLDDAWLEEDDAWLEEDETLLEDDCEDEELELPTEDPAANTGFEPSS